MGVGVNRTGTDYLFEGDYVLLAEDGGNFDKPERGVAYEVSGKFWVNNHAHILKPRDEMSPRFLRYWLNAIDWMPHVGGTTRAKLTQAGMAQVSIPLPPRAEQRRIVAKLDSLTGRTARAREQLGRVPTLVQRYREAILAREFDEDRTKLWSTGPFERLITEGLIGLVRSKLEQSHTTGTPYIRMNHYDLDGRWNFDKLTCVTTTSEEFERFALKPGDVLFNTRNSAELVGKVAIWDGEPDKFVYNNNILRLRFRKDTLPEFAMLYMTSPQFRKYLESAKSATTSVAAIYNRSLYAAPFPIPSRSIQRQIVNRVKTALRWLDRVAAEHDIASRLLPKLDHAILAKAFRGELVPQDPDDEPASVPLERVRAATADGPKRGRLARHNPGITESSIPEPQRTAVQQDQDMTKSRKDVSAHYLSDIVKKSGGRIGTEALWRASEMSIDEFYKLLRDELEANRLKESSDKASITNAN